MKTQLLTGFTQQKLVTANPMHHVKLIASAPMKSKLSLGKNNGPSRQVNQLSSTKAMCAWAAALLLVQFKKKDITMAYILKNSLGQIIAASASEELSDDGIQVDAADKTYIKFLENSLAEGDAFRESDIHLARVLEDLISLLVERNTIRFTDLPEQAQKRLNQRQSMRSKSQLSGILDESNELF
jgi:hypothetical protein